MEKNRKALDFIKMTEKQREDTQQSAEQEADNLRTRTQKLMKEKHLNNAALDKI